MKRIVVSQPMYFPWVGIFEQVRLADVFIHYDDALLPQGRSFISRVQVKTPAGVRWLSVPLKHGGQQPISQVRVDDGQQWRQKHLKTLVHSYTRAPYFENMIGIAETVYAQASDHLCDLNIRSIEAVADYFGLTAEYVRASDLRVAGHSSEKLLRLVLALHGSHYLTGHGARHYLDHDLFERHGIRVEYMTYNRTAYPQLHGAFDPHVTVLDLIANTGPQGGQYINSGTMYWKDFLHE
jgi:hypothetical protein